MADVIRLKASGGVDQFEVADIELPPPQPTRSAFVRPPLASTSSTSTSAGALSAAAGQYSGRRGRSASSRQSAPMSRRSRSATGSPMRARRWAPTPRAHSARVARVRLPDRCPTHVVASVFVKGITAYMLLTRVYPVGRGTTVLIHSAAGGLGQLLTRWARHLGATVIGTVGSDAKAAAARCGRPPRHRRSRCRFRAAVADLTDSGVDVAYDGVGGATLAKTLQCVRPFGVVASIGQSAGAIPPIDVEDLGPRRSLMLARPSVMAYMNGERTTRARDAVLAALEEGILQAGRSILSPERRRAGACRSRGRAEQRFAVSPTVAGYSAGCSAACGFFGAIQNAAGRSNRKLAPAVSAIRQIASAPSTPTMVTTSEIVPMSWMMPVRSSSVRVAAIGRKNAR